MRLLIYTTIGVALGVFIVDSNPELAEQIRVWTDQAIAFLQNALKSYS